MLGCQPWVKWPELPMPFRIALAGRGTLETIRRSSLLSPNTHVHAHWSLAIRTSLVIRTSVSTSSPSCSFALATYPVLLRHNWKELKQLFVMYKMMVLYMIAPFFPLTQEPCNPCVLRDWKWPGSLLLFPCPSWASSRSLLQESSPAACTPWLPSVRELTELPCKRSIFRLSVFRGHSDPVSVCLLFRPSTCTMQSRKRDTHSCEWPLRGHIIRVLEEVRTWAVVPCCWSKSLSSTTYWLRRQVV